MQLINSVLGFNFDLELVDNNDQLIKTGVRTILPESNDEPNVGNKLGGKNWFTNFNEPLLSKIRDYKRIHD